MSAANGGFAWDTANVPEGYTTIAARVGSGPWRITSFVNTSNPQAARAVQDWLGYTLALANARLNWANAQAARMQSRGQSIADSRVSYASAAADAQQVQSAAHATAARTERLAAAQASMTFDLALANARAAYTVNAANVEADYRINLAQAVRRHDVDTAEAYRASAYPWQRLQQVQQQLAQDKANLKAIHTSYEQLATETRVAAGVTASDIANQALATSAGNRSASDRATAGSFATTAATVESNFVTAAIQADFDFTSRTGTDLVTHLESIGGGPVGERDRAFAQADAERTRASARALADYRIGVTNADRLKSQSDRQIVLDAAAASSSVGLTTGATLGVLEAQYITRMLSARAQLTASGQYDAPLEFLNADELLSATPGSAGDRLGVYANALATYHSPYAAYNLLTNPWMYSPYYGGYGYGWGGYGYGWGGYGYGWGGYGYGWGGYYGGYYGGYWSSPRIVDSF